MDGDGGFEGGDDFGGSAGRGVGAISDDDDDELPDVSRFLRYV